MTPGGGPPGEHPPSPRLRLVAPPADDDPGPRAHVTVGPPPDAGASSVISALVRGGDEGLGDRDRRMFEPYSQRLAGSAGPLRVERARAWMAVDWLVRTFSPLWLRVAGLGDEASRVAQLPELRPGSPAPPVVALLDALHQIAAAHVERPVSDQVGAAVRVALARAAGPAAAAAGAAAIGASGVASAAIRVAASAATAAAAGAAAPEERLDPTARILRASATRLVERMLVVDLAAPDSPTAGPTLRLVDRLGDRPPDSSPPQIGP